MLASTYPGPACDRASLLNIVENNLFDSALCFFMVVMSTIIQNDTSLVSGQQVPLTSSQIVRPSLCTNSIGLRKIPILKENGIFRSPIELVRKDGRTIWLDVSGVLLSETNEVSLWMMVDITAMKKHHEEVERIAFHDILTGLPNRMLVLDRLKQALAQAERSKQFLAVCYLDLDGFKPVNDEFGHAAGDKLLVEVAVRMQVWSV